MVKQGVSEDIQTSLKRIFFDVYRSKNTYKNLAFSLLLFPIGVGTFIYVTIGLSVSLSLMIIGIGFLINYYFLLSLPKLVYGISRLSTKILGIPQEIDFVFREPEGTFFQKYIELLKRKEIWFSLVYFNLLFFVTLITYVSSMVFVISGSMVRIDPIYKFLFGKDLNQDFHLSGLGFPQWVETYEIYILSFVGYLVMTFQLHFVNWFVKKHAWVLTKILSQN